MSNERRDEELRELIALAAVGALADDERAALDRELAARQDMQAELAELEDAAASMAVAAAEEPPARLRSDVMAVVRDVPPPSAVTDLDRARRQRRRRWLPVAAAAAVVVLAGVGVAVLRDGDGAESEIAAVVEDEESVTVSLDGETMTLRLIHSPANDASALVGEDGPPPDGDQVYELWLLADAAPVPIEIFRPTDDGVVEILLPDVTPTDEASFAVTIEPPGGSPQPTGDIVAASA